MEYIKTYEGFFDGLFGRKKKDLDKPKPDIEAESITEDDKIINMYFRRLERIKGISPYDIQYTDKGTEQGEQYWDKYTVLFDDVPFSVRRVASDLKYSEGWADDTQKNWISNGGIRKNNHVFYRIVSWPAVSSGGDDQNDDDIVPLVTSWPRAEQLFKLAEKLYKQDKYSRRIKRITDEINPAADLLDPDIYPDKDKDK
jgi:hypothetical protein